MDITSEETLKPFVVQITGLPMLPHHTCWTSIPQALTDSDPACFLLQCHSCIPQRCLLVSSGDCLCCIVYKRLSSPVLQQEKLLTGGPNVFAGPMIRIIGDRLSWEIKAALLHTIGLLIAKAGPGLKPFVPQLQTTFLKCLGDQVCFMDKHSYIKAEQATYLC